jgi:protein TonB
MKLYAWILVSIALHAGLARIRLEAPRDARVDPRPPVEVEVVAPPPRREEPRVTEPETRTPLRHAPARRAPAPAPRVPAVLTSGEADDGAAAFPPAHDGPPPSPAHDDEPVTFAAEPTYGVRPPKPTAQPAPAKNENLSRPARLDEADPCRGHFPTTARADGGTVTLAIAVDARGAVTSAAVVSESPAGEGFGAAARACLLEKRFSPARGGDGRATASSAGVRIHFSR